MSALMEDEVAQTLKNLDAARMERVRMDAAREAVEREQARILEEAQQSFGIKDIGDLRKKAEAHRTQMQKLLAEAGELLSGGSVF